MREFNGRKRFNSIVKTINFSYLPVFFLSMPLANELKCMCLKTAGCFTVKCIIRFLLYFYEFLITERLFYPTDINVEVKTSIQGIILLKKSSSPLTTTRKSMK